jgi:outer membrane lipoprotein-sorting protein
MSEADIRANFSAQLGKEATLRDGTRVAQLILTPLAKSDYTLVDMWVDSDGMPRQIKITLVNRDTDTWFLSQIQKNVRVDRKEFDPPVPKGIKVQPV